MLSVRDRRLPCFLEMYEYEASIVKASADPAVSLALFQQRLRLLEYAPPKTAEGNCCTLFLSLYSMVWQRGNCIRMLNFYSNLAAISSRMILIAGTAIAISIHKVCFSSWTYVLRTSGYA
jgi:hypothetical protein